MADRYLKHSIIASSLYGLTKNGITLHLQATAQWEKCAAKFLSIPAIILLFGGSLKCLYLSQISTDLHSVKKHLNASVLPQFLSTHLTSSFNFRKVQIWLHTFPLCIALNKTFMEVDGIGQLSRFHCIINYGTQIVSLKKSQSATNIWNFPCS